MKWIKYNLCITGDHNTDKNSEIEKTLSQKILSYSESNLAIAEREAYSSNYTIEDDGLEEAADPTLEDRVKNIELFIKKIKALFPEITL